MTSGRSGCLNPTKYLQAIASSRVSTQEISAALSALTCRPPHAWQPTPAAQGSAALQPDVPGQDGMGRQRAASGPLGAAAQGQHEKGQGPSGNGLATGPLGSMAQAGSAVQRHHAAVGAREVDVCRRAVLVWLLHRSIAPRLESEGLMPLLIQVGAVRSYPYPCLAKPGGLNLNPNPKPYLALA